MELDDMRNAWLELSTQVEKQKQLTDKLIITMTHERYKNKLSSIRIPELLSSFVCFGFAALLLAYFTRYDSPLLIAFAIFSIGYFLIMPVLSLRSIRHLQNLDITHQNHKQVLMDYAIRKRHLLNVQKISRYLALVLIITTLPLMLKIMAPEKEIKAEVWYWYIPCMLIFAIYFSHKVYRCYARLADQAEDLAKSLNE